MTTTSATPSATTASATASIEATAVKAKSAKALIPSLGDYLTAKLNEAKSQMGVYEAKLPPALAARVRNSAKNGLKITSIRDGIQADDEHGQAYLVSCRTVEAIERALELAVNLAGNRTKARDKATAKKA